MLGSSSRGRALVPLALAVLLLVVSVGVAQPTSAATPVRIYSLGDSITYGITSNTNKTVTPGGYRGFLHTMLTQRGTAHRFVGTTRANSSTALTVADQARHDGHPGYRIDQDADNLDGVAGANDDAGGHWITGTAWRPPIYPDVVIVHLGTNDVLKRYAPGRTFEGGLQYTDSEEKAIFVADLTDRLEALVDKLFTLRPETSVVLATAIPLDGWGDADLAMPAYADAVRQLVDEQVAAGRDVVLADAHRAFLTTDPEGRAMVRPGFLSDDGAHPTPTGYAELANVFDDAIVRVLR